MRKCFDQKGRRKTWPEAPCEPPPRSGDAPALESAEGAVDGALFSGAGAVSRVESVLVRLPVSTSRASLTTSLALAGAGICTRAKAVIAAMKRRWIIMMSADSRSARTCRCCSVPMASVKGHSQAMNCRKRRPNDRQARRNGSRTETIASEGAAQVHSLEFITLRIQASKDKTPVSCEAGVLSGK